ncbi:MEKHLA domain-containing protein [Picosynechococcus sp. PCC 7003]|uniref:MEKHLA domain-containing protein n=1 Tax=Picosynechococcus sp. PCC 7003 TaxID=374981 RepID=UPI000810E126|nr:MEKHLA domain-containing protein [Picosynechococcus sp. PCC 7003]ANV84508.1 MEKHLA domain-containing protein [Picosynechococcus sp. PCC 7003]
MEPWQLESTIRQTQLILTNYRRWFGEHLIRVDGDRLEQAKILFESPFVVFSHGTEADPIYNYGSRLGLELWERTWEELTQMPSRQSAAAEEQAQQERYAALVDSRNYGCKRDFSAVRVTKSGRPVRIENVKLYDLLDASGEYRGQAAVFSKWTFLDEITQ